MHWIGRWFWVFQSTLTAETLCGYEILWFCWFLSSFPPQGAEWTISHWIWHILWMRFWTRGFWWMTIWPQWFFSDRQSPPATCVRRYSACQSLSACHCPMFIWTLYTPPSTSAAQWCCSSTQPASANQIFWCASATSIATSPSFPLSKCWSVIGRSWVEY